MISFVNAWKANSCLEFVLGWPSIVSKHGTIVLLLIVCWGVDAVDADSADSVDDPDDASDADDVNNADDDGGDVADDGV